MMNRKRGIQTALIAIMALATTSEQAIAQTYRDRLPQDEVVYFLLPDRFENGDRSNDRGGLTGDRLATGYDATDKGFYHGGDLKGLIARLGYIQQLGATAIWLGPIFRNKPVQGSPGHQSAGYHGYWITDFTHVDPHLGTDQDFSALVDAAHAHGMKVYMDIVANHTADVIQYRECMPGRDCVYRSRADYPYQRRGGSNGREINAGFRGDDVRTQENFARLTRPDYAYTPYVPPEERHVKRPDWLNDPMLYHNRGNSTFAGESSTQGDFSGLDDLMTENPRVLNGMIALYGSWIDRFGIDGFRIDTARHVDAGFWRTFVPAMLKRAAAKGIPNFHIFGEVALPEPAVLAEHTRVDKLPTVLDFGFRQAVLDTVAGSAGTDAFARLFAADALYQDGYATAVQLPTFTGNHDDGRFASFVRRAFPVANDTEMLKRVELANAMLMTLRGVPTIYAGDEQGFMSDGRDQDAREDMFGSQVSSYNDNRLLGSTTTTATAHFTPGNPLFRQIAMLSRMRRETPALTRGLQRLRHSGSKPGLLALSRFDPSSGREVLLTFNTSADRISQQVQIETMSQRFRTLAGDCVPVADAPGSVRVTLPPFGYGVCAAE